MNRFDESGMTCVVAKDLAELADRLGQGVLGHRHIGPDRMEQLLVRHQLAGALQKMSKNRVRLGTQGNGFLAAHELPREEAELKRWKRDRGHVRIPCGVRSDSENVLVLYSRAPKSSGSGSGAVTPSIIPASSANIAPA